MKYEVGKAYIHDGSAECPLPKNSRARYLTERGTGWGKDADICWTEVLCFVPVHIPLQPREFWMTKFGDLVGGVFPSKDMAIKQARPSAYAYEIIHVREVIE